MLLNDLKDKKIISPPDWLAQNTLYLTIMGSVAYGVSEDTSDFDTYGYAIPPRHFLFPHLRGHIAGFGKEPEKFDNYQQHHCFDPDALGGKGREYDFDIYNITRFFTLCMKGTPNSIDALYTPRNCVLHSTFVSEMVRDKRHLFLSKKIWWTFKGYSLSQLNKANGKNPEEGSKRKKLRDKYGMDTKYLYHVVRLLSECEQILMYENLDLQEKGRREHMKAIRRGEVSEADIRAWAADKEKHLENLFHNSRLRDRPDEDAIRQLLIDCLEHHYGSLGECVVNENEALVALREIQSIIEKKKTLLG